MIIIATPPPQTPPQHVVSETRQHLTGTASKSVPRDTTVSDSNLYAMWSHLYATQESASEPLPKTEAATLLLPKNLTVDSAGIPGSMQSTSANSLRAVANFVKGLELSIDDRTCEEYYQRLGWTTGPFVQPARKTTRQFWVSKGPAGAGWLAKRVATESQVDVLEAVASLLADFGKKA